MHVLGSAGESWRKLNPAHDIKRCSFLQLLSFTGSNNSTNHCFQFRITCTQFGFLQYLSPPMLKDECKNWWAPNPKSDQCRLSSHQYLTFDCSTTFVPTINKFFGENLYCDSSFCLKFDVILPNFAQTR